MSDDVASDAIARNVDVAMERPSLEAPPPVVVPEGYTLRPFTTGDAARWRAIQAAADQYNDITPSLFSLAFGENEAEHRARIFFAIDSRGDAIGTAAAWHGEESHEERGRVHWVAVMPSQQGRGVGRALVAESLNRMRALGHTAAYLTTSAARLPAIGLYVSLGFVPSTQTDEERSAWATIERALKRR